MFEKWLEEYQKITLKTGFISKLAAFLVSLFSFFSLYDIVNFFSENPQALESFVDESNLIRSIIFQASILTVFSVRFVLAFFDREKHFWLNQILWLLGFSLLIIYWYVSKPGPESYGIYSMSGPMIFRNASRYFDTFGMWYLILSPTRRFAMFIYSLIKIGRNKI